MKILAISDTHGHLHLINDLAKKYQADVVLHCGDFGFYSETADALAATPDRELTLRVHHAQGIDPAVKKSAFKLTREEKIEVIKKEHLLGEFELFVQGHLRFDVPVYCVPGNHEDVAVVNKLYSKELVVPNLHMLDEDSDVILDGWIRLVGIGGNFIHWNFFDKKNSDAYYPSMRMSQWCTLYERFVKAPRAILQEELTKQAAALEAEKGKKKRAALKKQFADENKEREEKAKATEPVLWVMTHVSPGKLPFLERMSLLLKPTFWFSGHMDPFVSQAYCLFTMFEDWEWADRATRELQVLRFMLLRNANWAKGGALAKALTDGQESSAQQSLQDSWISKISPNDTVEYNMPADCPRWTEGTDIQKFSKDLHDYFCVTHFRSDNEKQKGKEEEKDQKADEPKKVEDKVFSKAVASSGVNVGGLASEEEYAHVLDCAVEMLNLPALPQKPACYNEGTEEYDAGAIVTSRKPCDLVKGATFLNLPDAYMGGYVLVETDAGTRTTQVQAGGSIPPRSIVTKSHRQVWEEALASVTSGEP